VIRLLAETGVLGDSNPVLSAACAKHLRVVRPKDGEEVELFDGNGSTRLYRYGKAVPGSGLEAVREAEFHSPPASRLTLFACVTKGARWDWTIEKATELGVDRVVIVPAERSVTKLDEKRLAKRLEQWKNTTISACEQCARLRFPTVDWVPNLKTALSECNAAQKIILAPAATMKVRLEKTESVAFAVGPEGGFSEKEIELAQSFGFDCMLLGPRVLRTETAGLVALSVAQWAIGDFQ
jgi:16S rRNA (uracil1498-N3)-methyltransferase